MRDRRDTVIAVLAAALLFCLGLLVGRGDLGFLPAAHAQDGGGSGTDNGFDPEQPAGGGGAGGTAPPTADDIREQRFQDAASRRSSSTRTATDSNSNNRFVAVTTPIGSGESALFVLDSKQEQLIVYRYHRGKGLEFLAGRKIDMDLRLNQYKDISEFSRDDMQREYRKQIARAAAEAAKQKSKGG